MNKRELVEALLAGKEVRNSIGTKLIFSQFTTGSPFLVQYSTGEIDSMSGLWEHVDDFHVVTPWQENIGKGKLCWVWNNNVVDKRLRLIVEYRGDGYATAENMTWNCAEPLTPEELKEYSI